MFAEFLDALVPSRAMYDQFDDPSDRSPVASFWYTPLGIPEIAGAPTTNSQYFCSACFAASRLLCAIGSTSAFDLKQLRMIGGRKTRVTVDSHGVHRLINFRPNPDQTAIQFRALLIAWQVNWGTAFAEIQRDLITKEVVALWPIHPRRMRPFRDREQNLWWHVTQPDGTTEDLPDTELLRLPYIVSEDGGITGLGVAYQARRAIGLTLTLERSESQASKSGVPRIVVETPKMMLADSRTAFRREWKELHEQGGEAVALLTEGATAKPLDYKMTDQQHVQRREFLIEEVARWYDVTLNMLRRAIKELAGNVEQQGIDFKTYSLRFLDIWKQELAYKLLTPEEIGSGFYFEFDFADLLRGDLAALSEFYRSMNAIGVYSANDILDKLGENPHADGDTYFVQGAMRPIDEPYATGGASIPGEPVDGKASPDSAPKARVERAIRLLMQATLQRMASKEAKRASDESNNPKTFIPKMEEFYVKHREQLTEAIGPICEAAMELGSALKAESLAHEWCESSMQLLLESSGVTVDRLTESVGKTIASWNNERVETKVAAMKIAA